MARPEFLTRILEHTAPTGINKTSETIEEHIRSMWPILTRTHEHWFLGALEDPKVAHRKGEPHILYISDTEDMARVEQEVREARDSVVQKIEAADRGAGEPPRRIIDGRVYDATDVEELPQVEVRRLPRNAKGEIDVPYDQHGLLYLPHPYIVPGVRFNEMYNWDSAFVVNALLEDGQVEPAKHIVDNMLYQIEHYGTILNGNRSYYIEGAKPRSQPPLLTDSIMEIYRNHDAFSNGQEDRAAWLKRVAGCAERYHAYWTTPPHLHEKSGLSLHSSTDGTPGAEVAFSEPEHYEEAFAKLKAMHAKQQAIGAVEDIRSLSYQDRKDRYYIDQYLEPDGNGDPLRLSEDFYRGDRAMRESGLDPSRLFGFFNVDIINYVPLSLNCLRQKMESETADIYRELAKAEPENRDHWREKEREWRETGGRTAAAIRDHLWDKGTDVSERGQERKPAYRDRNVNTALLDKYALDAFRHYDFATALMPMWTGIASDVEAAAVVDNVLPKLRTIYGLQASSRETGSQWDAPMLWAPLQVIAVEALEKYHYYNEAVEIGRNYLSTIVDDFRRCGKVHEKTEALNGSSYTQMFIDKGYATNDEGFAWTNAAVLKLAAALDRIEEKIQRRPLIADHFPEKQTTPAQKILARQGADGADPSSSHAHR